ncbi:hypothetical protein NPIL_301161 [Nephila pilipes]|uniref:Uncharacterized protein n=1 Tax=Nephila pilipes TaxID=299642 RepID=A0A8X6TQU4_NEPPI|nr:hypothetical protein NPIL_301161 [Nephila pilipes]
MEDDSFHDSMHAKLPAEKASIEAILTTMETTVTSDGLLHIANCVEANLSNAIAQPHHSDESTQYIVDLQEIMDEVRSRYMQTREKEIDMEANRLKDRLNQWGIIQRAETQFTPVKGKNKTRKSADAQAAKKPRTENTSYTNRFSSLAIEEDEGENEMDAGEITPMPSPTKSIRNIPHPNSISADLATKFCSKWNQLRELLAKFCLKMKICRLTATMILLLNAVRISWKHLLFLRIYLLSLVMEWSWRML